MEGELYNEADSRCLCSLLKLFQIERFSLRAVASQKFSSAAEHFGLPLVRLAIAGFFGCQFFCSTKGRNALDGLRIFACIHGLP